MKDGTEWVLLDTETNGITDPIFVVDIAAQRMSGWDPISEPFQALLNQNVAIPPEASRLNGYTREILERDGIPAWDAYKQLGAYVGTRPIIAYNLAYDFDRVLIPEWARLGVSPFGQGGFCILRLTQRLLDPVPAGNCKLQTLRQFYRLPERGSHTALGDTLTVVDLVRKVLSPLASEKGLNTWEDVVRFVTDEWYPTRLAFGKYKGRSFWDARHDKELFQWIEWLSTSKKSSTAKIANWYLNKLKGSEETTQVFTAASFDTSRSHEPRGTVRTGIVVFQSIELEELKYLIAAARERLADLEVIYARECNSVAVTQSKLFYLLKDAYKKRDQIRLTVSFRQRYLDSLRVGDDSEAEIQGQYKREKDRSNRDYDEATKSAEEMKTLTEEQQAELKTLFRKLVKLFHPDRYANDPEAYKTYTRLTQEITAARDAGDIDKLKEIASDPASFARKLGAGLLDLSDDYQLEKLKRLYESIQSRILEMLEALNELHSDSKYQLAQLAARRPEYLAEVANDFRAEIEKECFELEQIASGLANEISELTGDDFDGLQP
jgi:DNA polymerase III epsilon subunit-like protein